MRKTTSPLPAYRAIALVLLVSLAQVVAPKGNALAQNCRSDGTGLVPITEMGEADYRGQAGGLYPDGGNSVPAQHLATGLELAAGVEPLDDSGSPSPEGTIGLISIGVSNTRDEFTAFIQAAADQADLNPRMTLVNGAQGARDLNTWANASRSNPWRNVATALPQVGVSPLQLQVAWIMLPERSQGTPILEDIPSEVEKLTSVVQHLKTNFPNVRLAFLSSRIYGGYSTNGEPRAYQHGFTVRAFIAEQMSGDPALNPDPAQGPVSAPWIAWGPYTWADGTTPREDGLTWECADFEADGIHPSVSGADKVAHLLIEHFRTHPTASSWFLGSDPTTTATSTPLTATTSTTSRASTTDTIPADSTTEPPSTSAPAVDTSFPPAPAGRLDVPWVLGGVALGLVLALGAAWSRGGRRPPRDPPGQDDLR